MTKKTKKRKKTRRDRERGKEICACVNTQYLYFLTSQWEYDNQVINRNVACLPHRDDLLAKPHLLSFPCALSSPDVVLGAFASCHVCIFSFLRKSTIDNRSALRTYLYLPDCSYTVLLHGLPQKIIHIVTWCIVLVFKPSAEIVTALFKSFFPQK